MIVVDHIALDEDILTQPFACDLKACKGACCTMEGGTGAPLQEKEIPLIESALDAASQYLPENARDTIRKQGWLAGKPGEWTVNCIDDAQCVFVFFEESVAKCALERAYFENKSSFRKPISCHLFPIRVADFGGTYLYYDRFPECAPAIRNGMMTDTRVVDTSRDALVREFGKEWTDTVCSVDLSDPSA